jgi:hypothetical protein
MQANSGNQCYLLVKRHYHIGGFEAIALRFLLAQNSSTVHCLFVNVGCHSIAIAYSRDSIARTFFEAKVC